METLRRRLGSLFCVLFLSCFVAIGISPLVVYAQSVSVLPSSGGAGTIVTITGSGFPVSTAFTIKLDGSSIASGTTTSGGQFTKTVTIPATLTPGTKVINVTAEAVSVDRNFSLLPPTIAVTPQGGFVGTSVTVTGQMFPPGASYSLTFGSSTITNGTIDSIGRMSTRISVPSDSSPGNISIMVTAGGVSASSSFYVPSPVIAVAPQQGAIGSTVTITAQNFPPGASYSLTFGNSTITSGTIDGSGRMSTTISVPSDSSPGAKSIVVAAGGMSASALFDVPSPVITVAPQQGVVGTTITISGQNFPADASFTLKFENSSVANGRINNVGQMSAKIDVPSGHQPASKTVTVTAGSLSASRSFDILPGSISISPKEGKVGSPVKVNGQGFNHKEQVTILLDGRQMASVTSSSSGTFDASFSVIAASAGSHEIAAQDALNNISPAERFNVIPNLKYEGPDQVTVGSTITVSGTGFTGNSTVTLAFEGASSGEQQVQCDAFGSFGPISLKIEDITGGQRKVIAKDSKGIIAIPDTSLQIRSSAELVGPTSGSYDMPVTIRGRGFSANEKNFTVLIGNSQIGIAQSDSKGSFDFKGKVLEMPGGQWDIVVRDPRENSTFANAKFTIESIAGLDSSDGHVGKQVKFSGKGYKAETKANLFWDGIVYPDYTVETSARGSFSGTFTVPKSKNGTHALTITDGTNTRAFNWVVENTPPPAPTLLEPANAERIGHLWSQTPTLKWTAVQDPSGVTYQLLVSNDATFKNRMLSRESLTTNMYSLQKGEALGRGYYYWSVRAVDGAENASPWTSANGMQIGSDLPIWLSGTFLAILAGAAILIRLLVGFTPKQRVAVAATRADRKARKQEQMIAEEAQQEELNRLKSKIHEMAEETRGILQLKSITSSLNIDEDTAQRCLKELKAMPEKDTLDTYYFPDIEEKYKKKKG